jgi:hypothetical protein
MLDSFSPIDPALVDFFLPSHDGYPAELAIGDTGDVLRDVCGSASREFPQALWIEPSNWPDKARENDLHKTWPLNYVDRFTHQGGSHECTCHSLRAILEGCRNRQRGVSYPDGPKKGFRYEESAQFGSVWLSPNSVYAEANPRQRGGAGIRQVLEIAVRRGMLPSKMQPREYGLAHTLVDTAGGTQSMNQAVGPWVSVSQFPSGWQETAKWFKPLEVIFPSSWEQAVCLVLHGYLVGVGRSGHAIPWGQWNVAQQAMAYADSYDVIRYDSLSTVKRAWSGSFAVASMTTPSDWSKPAGDA